MPNSELISDIPLIPEVPEPLRLAAMEGRLVPFVGAGVSRIAGSDCPSWDELADRLFDQLRAKGALNYSSAEQLQRHGLSARVKLSLIRNIAAEQKIELDYVTAIHRNRDVSSFTGRSIYGALGRLSRSFVTTNYDVWLDTIIVGDDGGAEPAGGGRPTRRSSIYRLPDISFARLREPNTVVHLHGSIDDTNADNLIMTTGQYLTHYRADLIDNNRIVAFLRTLFAECVVLFVGYGLEELEILEYVLTKRHPEDNNTHYILQPFFSHELTIAQSLQRYYEKECGVTLLPFLRDTNNYLQLSDVLQSFAQQMPASDALSVQRRQEMEGLL